MLTFRKSRSFEYRAWRISILAAGWTLLASPVTLVLGVLTNSAALASLGAVGLVDAVGSLALVFHFHHLVHHDTVSTRLEQRAHRLVSFGLVAVGGAALFGALLTLLHHAPPHPSLLTIGWPALTAPVLWLLAVKKRALATALGDRALRADAHLSAVGATQAVIALAGLALVAAGWWWADPLAASMVGALSVSLGVASFRAPAP